MNRKTVLMIVTLLLLTLVLCRGIRKGEPHVNADEAHHAVTGLYFADLLSDRPWSHPVQYTYEYYARYPALGLIHWPPFFHLIEGLAFLLVGPSVVTARLTILLFTLFGFYFWFKLVTLLHGEWAGVSATLLLSFLPFLLFYEKIVMLEVPSLALCIAASYFWILYLMEEQGRRLYWFVVLASLALLTKQHSIYLLAFCLLSLISTRRWRSMLNWKAIKALGLSALLVGPFYVLAFLVHGRSIASDVLVGTLVNDHPSLFYLLGLPQLMGWPFLTLSILGIATSPWWDKRLSSLTMLSWIAACFLTFTPIGQKDLRYFVYVLPPLVYFIVGPWVWLWRQPQLRFAGAAALVLMLVNQTVQAWTYQPLFVSGYAAVAQSVVGNRCSGVILVDGDLTADFIFYLRVFEPAKRFVVLRKALYATNIMAQYGSIEVIHGERELQQLIDDYGIRCVIVEENAPLKVPAQKALREMLQGPGFQPAGSFPLDTNISEFRGRRILVYENKAPKPLTASVLHVRMLTLDRDIVVPVNRIVVPSGGPQ